MKKVMWIVGYCAVAEGTVYIYERVRGRCTGRVCAGLRKLSRYEPADGEVSEQEVSDMQDLHTDLTVSLC